jgi:hypothetical protein
MTIVVIHSYLYSYIPFLPPFYLMKLFSFGNSGLLLFLLLLPCIFFPHKSNYFLSPSFGFLSISYSVEFNYSSLGTYVGILEQSMGARNRVGIGLSYRSARLHRLAERLHRLAEIENRFLGSLKVKNTVSSIMKETLRRSLTVTSSSNEISTD